MQPLANTRGERIAVVSGIRTPFVQKNTAFRDSYASDLGAMVANELLNRTPIERQWVEKFIFGQVIQQPDVPNLSREIALTLGMPRAQAYSLSSSCITGLQAVGNIVNGIVSHSISIGIAGGADSISNAPIGIKPKVGQLVRDIIKASSYKRKAMLIKRLSWQDFLPRQVSLSDPFTSHSLADVSERISQQFAISRQDLDEYSARSHRLASEAWEKGLLNQEVMIAHPTPYKSYVGQDNMISPQYGNASYYRELKPLNREKRAVTTNWNISEPADGAAAVLLMREGLVEELDLPVLGYIRSFAISGNEVWENMMAGATYATSLALHRSGLELNDIDLIDMHESSAAQVLTNMRLWESDKFARDHLHRERAIGSIDMNKFNVMGGSLAYGSPRAITSLRILIQNLHALNRQGGELALLPPVHSGD